MQRLLNVKREERKRFLTRPLRLPSPQSILHFQHIANQFTLSDNDKYHCKCISVCVPLLCVHFFIHSNWRQSLVASTQKTCVCFHGNSGLNTSPSRWSDDEGVHRFSADTPVFTAGRRHVTRLRWWQGNCFLLSLRVAATGPFQRAMLDGMKKYGLRFPEHSRNAVNSVLVPELLCTSEEGVERLSHSWGPNCEKLAC